MKKKYDDDDGRVIASMDGIEPPNLLSVWGSSLDDGKRNDMSGSGEGSKSKSQLDLSGKEKMWCILGALKAALLIGLAYALAFGAFIALLLFVWDLKS